MKRLYRCRIRLPRRIPHHLPRANPSRYGRGGGNHGGGLVGGEGYPSTGGRGGHRRLDFRFRKTVGRRHPQLRQFGTVQTVEPVGGTAFYHE